MTSTSFRLTRTSCKRAHNTTMSGLRRVNQSRMLTMNNRRTLKSRLTLKPLVVKPHHQSGSTKTNAWPN